MAKRDMDALFEGDDVQSVLAESFYKPKSPKKSAKKKPDHYEIICISLYKEDLAQLDEMVESLKTKGHRKMSRSALIRFALSEVDLDKLPRSY